MVKRERTIFGEKEKEPFLVKKRKNHLWRKRERTIFVEKEEEPFMVKKRKNQLW